MARENNTRTFDYTVTGTDGRTRARRCGPGMAAGMVGNDMDTLGPVAVFRSGCVTLKVDAEAGTINGVDADVRSGAVVHLLAAGVAR